MHRIDTATAQQDKFGQGKNGFTNGDPATGRRATDLNSDMWDAIQEEICAVIEQSGLDLDKGQHDLLYKAIVKIITSKIPDALLKNNNLSDLADKAIARANLQLKSAAMRDVTTSTTDKTSGRVLKFGDFGVGAAMTIGTATDLNTITIPGQYKQTNTSVNWSGLHYPLSSAGGLVVIEDAGYSDGCTQLYFPWRSNIIYYRNYSGTGSGYAWGEWAAFYSTLNKPTPAEIKALPIAGGGMEGIITLDPTAGSGMWSQQNDATHLAPAYQKIDSTAASYFFPLIKQRYVQGKSTWSMGTLVNENKFCLHFISTDDSAGKIFSWQKDGQFIPPSYSNFDERYQAKGSYYTTTQADARFQAIGSYYTTTQTDARYQLKNTASKAINGWFKDTSTGLVYQWGTTAAIGDDTLSTLSFPIAFPSACVAFLPTLKRSTVTANNLVMLSVWGQAMSNSSANIVFQSNSTDSDARSGVITWWAVGY